MDDYKTIPVDATNAILNIKYICDQIARVEGFILDTYCLHKAGTRDPAQHIDWSIVKNTEITINDTKYEVYVDQISTHDHDSTLYYRIIE